MITAQGQTHPVRTCFLEDIYEHINYHLASDSPASLRCETSTRDMVINLFLYYSYWVLPNCFWNLELEKGRVFMSRLWTKKGYLCFCHACYELFILLQRGPVNNRRGKKNLVLSAWGDDSLLSEEYVNPHYDSSHYQSYSEQTQQNLVLFQHKQHGLLYFPQW